MPLFFRLIILILYSTTAIASLDTNTGAVTGLDCKADNRPFGGSQVEIVLRQPGDKIYHLSYTSTSLQGLKSEVNQYGNWIFSFEEGQCSLLQ